jgi:hypothetical protein
MTTKPLISLLAFGLLMTGCDPKDTKEGSRSGSDSNNTSNIATSSGRTHDLKSARDKIRIEFEKAKLLEGDQKDQVLVEIAGRAMNVAPELLVDLLGELSKDSVDRNVLIESYVLKLVNNEKYDEATQWAESLSENDSDFAKAKIVIYLADKYPDEAASRLKASDFKADGVNPAAEQVVQSWVSKHPNDAVKWADNLPAGEARSAGFGVIFTSWVAYDPQAALAWAGSQTNKNLREESISAVVNEVKNVPDPIRVSILSQADPALREEVQQRLGKMSDTDDYSPPPEAEPVGEAGAGE